MDNAEVSDRGEDALKFMKCEVRTAFYYYKMARNLFNRLATVRGLGDMSIDRIEPDSPEDLYKFTVKNGQTGEIMAEGNLHEAKVKLMFPDDLRLRKENDFIKGYFELCGLRVA